MKSRVYEKKEMKKPKAPPPVPPSTTTRKMMQDSFNLDNPELLARRQKEIR